MTNHPDISIKFLDKIYGRESQIEELQKAFNKGLSTGSSMLFVKGASGMGKSALVSEFARQQVGQGAYFAKGKHDLSRNNPPYATIIQALNQLIEQWIDESEDKKEQIRTVLKSELVVHNQILTKAIPRLLKFFEVEKSIPTDQLLNFKDRFNEALLSFVNSLGKLNERIIIFLDDLQWVDMATVEFLKLWLYEGKANNLFFIGAFRDDEIDANNWLASHQIPSNEDVSNVDSLKLTGLSLEVISQMTSDIINVKDDRLIEFSEFLFQLTGGSPIYIRESLPFLLADGVLFYDADNETWDYDAARVKTFEKSSRTLEFIIRKMDVLSNETIELLGIGAAIGSDFNIALISAVTDKTAHECAELIVSAIDRRIIEPVFSERDDINTNSYRFIHDKMQHAAYGMMTEERRAAVHYALGRSYASSLGYAAQDRNIFDIVNQFNRCISYFDSKKERLELMKMNLKAGKKAKLTSSFSQALDYFNIVIQIIEANRQEWDKDVVFEVYLEAGEAAYLKSDFVSGVMFYESALKYTTTDFQKAKVHHNFLVMYNGVSDMEASWKSGLKALQLLNEKFPSNIGKTKVLRQFVKVKWLMRKLEPQALLDRPEIDNKEAEQRLLTLMEMIAAAWDKTPETLAYIVLKGCEIVIKNGNTPVGYFAVSGYGAILGMAFGKIEKGWEYIKLGGELTQKYDNMAFHGRGLFGVNGTYSHLIMHSKHNITPLEKAFTFSKGAGDYSISAYSSIILLENMFTIGTGLAELEVKAGSYFKFLKRTANYDYLSAHKSIVAMVRILTLGYEACIDRIDRIEKRMSRVSFHHIKYTWQIYRLTAMVVMRRQEEAIEIVEEISKKGYNALSSIELLNVICISIMKTDQSLQNRGNKKATKYLNKTAKQIDKFARINPDNYAQIAVLIKALQAELRNDFGLAVSHYKEAIRLSDKYRFGHFKALFEERLARLFFKHNKIEEGLLLIAAAKVNYQEWGATFKVQLLEAEITQIQESN